MLSLNFASACNVDLLGRKPNWSSEKNRMELKWFRNLLFRIISYILEMELSSEIGLQLAIYVESLPGFGIGHPIACFQDVGYIVDAKRWLNMIVIFSRLANDNCFNTVTGILSSPTDVLFWRAINISVTSSTDVRITRFSSERSLSISLTCSLVSMLAVITSLN